MGTRPSHKQNDHTLSQPEALGRSQKSKGDGQHFLASRDIEYEIVDAMSTQATGTNEAVALRQQSITPIPTRTDLKAWERPVPTGVLPALQMYVAARILDYKDWRVHNNELPELAHPGCGGAHVF